MVRTQIQLSDEQVKGLKRLAAQRGVSMAELIREGADRILAESEVDGRRQRASDLVGRYSDAATDVAADHDRYLDDAYPP